MPLSKHLRPLATLFGSQLRRNFLVGVACNGLSAAVTMVAYPVYLAFLGFEDYGVWLALSSVLMLAQLGALGISPAITKYVADEVSRGDVAAAESYIVTALGVVSGSAAIVAAAIAFGRMPMVEFLNLNSAAQDTAISLAIPIAFLSAYSLISQVPFGVLVAVGRMDQLSVVQAMGKGLSFVLTWLMLMRGMGVASLLWGSFLSQALMHLVCEYLIWRTARLRMWRVSLVNKARLVTMLRFGAGIFGTSSVQLLGQPLNRMLLSRYGEVSMLPHFEIAYAASMQLRALLGTSAQSLLPEFSQAAAAGDVDRIKRLNSRATRFLLLTATPLYVPLFIFAPEVLRLWLHDRFSPQQVPCLRVMLLGSLAILFGASAYHYLLAVARVRSVFLSQTIQTVGTLVMVLCVVAAVGRLSPLALCVCASLGFLATSLWLVLEARGHLTELEAAGRSAK